MRMSKCSKCGVPITPNPNYKCHPCRREHNKAWRLRRKLEGRPVINSTESRRAYMAKYSQLPEIKKRQAENKRRYRQLPGAQLKERARRAIRDALRRKQLFRLPCEMCGALPTHGHHDDYNKPLEVRWLCRFHHDALHHQQAEGAA